VKRYATLLAIAAAMALAATASAQSPPTLKVQVVIAKYQGDKKISSMPYSLTVRADGSRASLRMGSQVPIVTTTVVQGDKGNQSVPSYTYKDVGTSIDCQANRIDDTQFKLDITIDDSAIATEPQGASRPEHPSFRSFRSSNTLVLKDGQTAQYTTATDKVSGEVMKADVTLTIVK
jgi:type II secretory pathway component GspD/PulD (secretin)